MTSRKSVTRCTGHFKSPPPLLHASCSMALWNKRPAKAGFWCGAASAASVYCCIKVSLRSTCVLWCVAVCCGALQSVAVCAVCCDVFQYAFCGAFSGFSAGRRARSQRIATSRFRFSLCVCCGVLQYVAVCCSVLQCVAACCSVLQCVAVCCVLQCGALWFKST